jgi:maltokinase
VRPTESPGGGSAGTPDAYADFLIRTRWFAGKGRPFHVSGVRRVGQVPGAVPDGPRVVVNLVEVTYDDEAAAREGAEDRTELYQVPLACYRDPESRLDHAFVGWWEDPELGWVHAYDAVHDREAMACWLRSFDRAADGAVDSWTEGDSPLAFHRLPGHDLDLGSHSTLFSGEQSNSSVAFGEDALMKVFRKVTPGINPDIQVHEVLTRAGSEHVASLYGWLDVLDQSSDAVIQLAMLQEFLRTASDGWDLALASVRNLFTSEDLHAREVGGDFSGESSRLGTALAETHAVLVEHFPTSTLAGAEVARLADAMTDRLDGALAAVPELAPYERALRDLYAAVAALEEVPVQRVHGDLHLGQTLRTADGWKIVDFEGEPARPLADRLLPDSPWRDVAGMLRSFDYAPHVVGRTLAEGDPAWAEQLHERAAEWSHRNRNHFLTAYAGRGLTDEEHTVLAAYEADKAVYETVYETRNRPGWVQIPLAAVARIGAP